MNRTVSFTRDYSSAANVTNKLYDIISCLALPANGDVPEITLTGWYVAPYLPSFDPNRNYIGAVILAVHDGNRWYHDGRKDKWNREARNHWDGRSIVTGKEYEFTQYSLKLKL